MRVLVIVSLMLAFAAPATAANPCKVACKTAKKTCLQSVVAAFVATKSGCVADPATKKECLANAKALRATAKTDCKAALKLCKTDCGTGGGGGGGGCRKSAFGDWLATVNGWRGLAGLPPVTENPDWSAGALAHARYAVRENVVGHTENPSSPDFSEAGLEAAQNGNVAGTSEIGAGDGWAVDLWMAGPFHAVGIIDPLLAVSGFGIFHESGPPVQTAAVLDVLRGRTGQPATGPVTLPTNGGVLPIDRYAGGEQPNPLTSCPGYEAPTGFPLIVMAGSGFGGATASASSLTRDGAPVEHCLFDGSNYVNPDAALQDTGRAVLASRDAVVMMAKAPLAKGATYQASVTVNGEVIAWSFTVDCP